MYVNFAELCGEPVRGELLIVPQTSTVASTDAIWIVLSDELWDRVAGGVWVALRATFLTQLSLASRSVTAVRSYRCL